MTRSFIFRFRQRSLEWVCLAASLFLLSGAVFSHAGNLLQNPGFEDGLANWNPNPTSSLRMHAGEEAASMGKMGLRFGGIDSEERVSMTSEKFPVQPGQIYRLTFWGRMGGLSPSLIVKFIFTGDDGKEVAPVNTPGFWPAADVKNGDAFEQYFVQAAVPDSAVQLHLHITFRAKNKDWIDVDDFFLTEMTPEAAAKTPLPPPIPIEPLLEEIKSNPLRGKAPPKIVLKLDDFGVSWPKGPMKQVHHHWLRIEKFAQERKIKVGIGVVVKGLEEASPEVFDWVKKLQASGLAEFWLHGYDHAGWTTADGKPMPEGRGRSVAEQTQREELCQKIAKEKLGFHFTSFGPTGSGPAPSHDAAMLDALQSDPFMKAILYPAPMDDMARKLEDKGKVTVLARVWAVNIEAFVGRPRFDVFLQGYAHNRGHRYFVLQGHPPAWGWDDTEKNEAYGNFLKIIDFLTAQGATFMTPTECAAFVKSSGSPVASAEPNP